MAWVKEGRKEVNGREAPLTVPFRFSPSWGVTSVFIPVVDYDRCPVTGPVGNGSLVPCLSENGTIVLLLPASNHDKISSNPGYYYRAMGHHQVYNNGAYDPSQPEVSTSADILVE
jgi:hypothetical protein